MLKKIVYLLVLNALFIALPSTAQKMTPSEMPKQRQLEEEQKKKEEGKDKDKDKNLSTREKKELLNIEKARADIFNDNATDVQNKTIPDKWKNESAVVIYQKMNYSFLRERVDAFVRRRIKLNDKAAVDYFSEFYYVTATGEGEDENIGIRIVKANGQTTTVNTKDAKAIEENIPSFYKANYGGNLVKYKKLAIPNLEPGDIIDYFNKTKEVVAISGNEYAFTPFISTLSLTYPIMKQLFTFTIDRGFFINFNSYNGAPAIKEGEAGIDANGRQRAQIKTYVLEDLNREKISKDIWNYPYRTSPSIKFQVVYQMRSSRKDTRLFAGEEGVAKNKVDQEEIQTVTINKLKATSVPILSDQIIAHLRKNFKKETDPEKIARESYYYLRYLVVNYYYRFLPVADQKEFFYVNDEKFAYELLKVFEYKKIEAQVVATVARSIGSLNDLLLSTELQYGVRAKNSNGKYIYLFPFSNHSTSDFINSDIEGADAYAFSLKKKDGPKLEKIIIPASSYQKNTYKAIFTINFDGKMENLKVAKKNIITGQFKDDNSTLALHNYDYKKEDDKKYNEDYKEETERGNKARLAEEKRKRDVEKEEKAKRQADVLKENLANDYELASFDGFELIEPGRYDDKPELIFIENFSIKNLISKAGKNYIFEIGKVIGKQFELAEKDMTRENDIYLGYAKSLINEITITIPDGYKAEGVEDLNFNIDNASGAFTSKVKQEGNKIVLSTFKAYKNNFDKKSNWLNMTAALEAAYKFSQKKIILKKVS